MTSLSVFNWFDGPVMRALGWTLAHSLWQGALFTLVAATIIQFIKNSRPAIRYNLLTALFALFIITTVITFIKILPSQSNVAHDLNASVEYSIYGSNTIDRTANTGSLNWFDWFSIHFDQYCNYVVAVWFLIFLVKFSQLIFQYRYAKRMRRDNNNNIPGWDEILRQLAQSIGVTRLVTLRESAIATVPVVMGIMKPIILLPVGLIANLPQQQVEAILLHELAHIRRNDYLVNFIQCIAETIFFFNPAVLWISALIREERENCCDDLAISITRSKTPLINALVAFQDYNTRLSLSTTAFPGRKYHLLRRIQRIAYNNNQNLNNMEKIFLATGLVITGLVALAFNSSHQQNGDDVGKIATLQQVISNNYPSTIAYSDSIPDEKKTEGRSGSITHTYTDGKKYRIILKNDVITELYIDGKEIPKNEIPKYKETVDKITAEILAKTEQYKKMSEQQREQARLMKEQAEMSRKLTQQNREQTEIIKEELNRRAKANAELMQDYILKQETLNKKVKETQMKQLELLKKSTLLPKDQELLMKKFYDSNTMKFETLSPNNFEYKKELELVYEQNQELLNKFQYFNDFTPLYNSNMNAELLKDGNFNLNRDAEITQRDIIIDLLEEKVIKTSKGLKLRLTSDELIVNGVKQSSALHKKFKDKYIKDDQKIELGYVQ